MLELPVTAHSIFVLTVVLGAVTVIGVFGFWRVERRLNGDMDFWASVTTILPFAAILIAYWLGSDAEHENVYTIFAFMGFAQLVVAMFLGGLYYWRVKGEMNKLLFIGPVIFVALAVFNAIAAAPWWPQG